jgi:predicted porin
MKRSLIVAALAATAATSALAQSNVTIYGRLNTSLERQDLNGVTRNGVENNSSRIGFKGTEDLGGGLKAMFVIEHGFDSTTGQAGAPFWGREATVGLSGNFGTVRVGNMPASEAYFATADYVSMHNHDTGSSSDALYSFTSVGALYNAIAYTSPTFGGTNFAIQYGLKEKNGPQARASAPLSIAANYDAGPLHLGAGYEEYDGNKSIALRALYEMGALTLGGYVENNSGDNKRDYNVRLAAAYAMGAGEVHGNVGIADAWNGASGTDKQFTVAYNHNLSKRTKVYTFYTKIDGANGFDFSSLALGVRHNF